MDTLIEKEELKALDPETHLTFVDLVMTREDSRRNYIINVMGIYEDNPILKRNSNFSTIIDEYITEDNFQLVQVFSQRIEKVESLKFEKA